MSQVFPVECFEDGTAVPQTSTDAREHEVREKVDALEKLAAKLEADRTRRVVADTLNARADELRAEAIDLLQCGENRTALGLQRAEYLLRDYVARRLPHEHEDAA